MSARIRRFELSFQFVGNSNNSITCENLPVGGKILHNFEGKSCVHATEHTPNLIHSKIPKIFGEFQEV